MIFKFIITKGLYNLVSSKYEANLRIYNNELKKSDKQKAEQKYYEAVFNDVCLEVSNKLSSFQTTLSIKLATYVSGNNFDPDELHPADIYRFVYWCITDREAKQEKCDQIEQHVQHLLLHNSFRHL